MEPQTHLVAVLGRGVVDDPEAPVLPAFDLGLTRGDGCFDATRIEVADDGSVHVDHLDAHLARLARSASALHLPEVPAEAWRELVGAALAAWTRPGEAVLRLMHSRGSEWASGGAPTGLLTISPLPASSRDQRRGISVVTLSLGRPAVMDEDTGWILGGVKTLSYAVNMAAAREAARRGADDALFVGSDGIALEGPRSALVWREGDRIVSTRIDGTGILASVTQDAIFTEAAREGVPTSFDLVPADRLVSTDGAWLVSAGRLVAPILRLDGAAVPHDGRWTARLTAWATGHPASEAE